MMRRIFIALCCLASLALAGCSKPPAQPPSQTEVQEFHAAIQEGDAAIVERLLQAKPGLVNVPDSSGQTPLKIANQRGNTELADVLKKHGGHE